MAQEIWTTTISITAADSRGVTASCSFQTGVRWLAHDAGDDVRGFAPITLKQLAMAKPLGGPEFVYVPLTDWLPIKSAPTDEMFIYLWKRDGKRAVGLAYKAEGGGWRDSEGNWNTRIKPTHWMPLPVPPT